MYLPFPSHLRALKFTAECRKLQAKFLGHAQSFQYKHNYIQILRHHRITASCTFFLLNKQQIAVKSQFGGVYTLYGNKYYQDLNIILLRALLIPSAACSAVTARLQSIAVFDKITGAEKPRLQSMAIFDDIPGAEKAQNLTCRCTKQLPSADHK